MDWKDDSAFDPRYLWITSVGTYLGCWFLQEVFERKLSLNPAIFYTPNNEANKIYTNENNKLTSKYYISRRLSKQLDFYGKYRITQRGTIDLIKGILQIIAIFFLFNVPLSWYIDHFINMDTSTTYYYIPQHFAASQTAYYLWELTASKYGKLNYPNLMHHIATIVVSLMQLLGFYIPWGNWYAIFGLYIACLPCSISIGLRHTKSNKYPNLTRKLFTFTLCWYLFFGIFINMLGQIFIITNAVMKEKIAIIRIIPMLIGITAWLYDDYYLIKHLNECRKLKYELIDILVGDGSKTIVSTKWLNKGADINVPNQSDIEAAIQLL